jgi:hypothetical protein
MARMACMVLRQGAQRKNVLVLRRSRVRFAASAYPNSRWTYIDPYGGCTSVGSLNGGVSGGTQPGDPRFVALSS